MSKGKELSVTLNLDADLYHEAEKIYKSKGLSFEDAIRLFLLQSVQMREYPLLVPKGIRSQILKKEINE